MHEFALERVLSQYGIQPKQIMDSQNGYRNEVWPILTSDNQMINVTFFKREPGILDRINRSDFVSEFLADHNLPTRKRIDDRILTLKLSDQTTKIAIYNYLPGNTIPWEAYTMDRIKTLGSTMAQMHKLLSDVDPPFEMPSVYDEYLQIIERMKKYFSDKHVKNALKLKLNISVGICQLEKFEKLLTTSRELADQQILHMDFVRGNILFEDDEISGILDFEKTAVGHVVVDIARTLAFLLVDCKYKTPRQVNKYFLESGYKKRGQITDIKLIEKLGLFVKMFLLYDFYKFLIHNPYEFLDQNEHFIRTRDTLAVKNVITYK